MNNEIFHTRFNDIALVRVGGVVDIIVGIAYLSRVVKDARSPLKLIAIDHGTGYRPVLRDVQLLMTYLSGESRILKPIYVVIRDREQLVRTFEQQDLAPVIEGKVVLCTKEDLALELAA